MDKLSDIKLRGSHRPSHRPPCSATPATVLPASTATSSVTSDNRTSVTDANVSSNNVAVCLPAVSISNDVEVNHFINKNGNKDLKIDRFTFIFKNERKKGGVFV